MADPTCTITGGRLPEVRPYGEAKSVFVICHDGGVEGYSGPVQATLDLETAEKLSALIGDSMVIFECKLWPDSDGAAWFQVEPRKA